VIVMMMDVDVDVMMMNSHTDQSERAKNEAPQDGRRPPSVGLLPSLSVCVCRVPSNVQRCQLRGKQPCEDATFHQRQGRDMQCKSLTTHFGCVRDVD
jgi:hypothetical protein